MVSPAEEVSSWQLNLFSIAQLFNSYKSIFYFLFVALLTRNFAIPLLKRLWQNRNGTNQSKFPVSNLKLNVSKRDNEDFIPYTWKQLQEQEIIQRSEEFYHLMNLRRTLRFFSKEPVPRKMIDFIIKTAGTSPSGAHMQPWTFVIVSKAEIKSELRMIVESEEKVNYERRMSEEWVNALKHLKTDWLKPYIEDAPYIILVFKQIYSISPEGGKINHYYVEQSLSIAVGILIAAIHYCGLVTLTSTPLNCGPAISKLTQRPKNEKLVYLLPVGFPAKDSTVPNLKRKSLEQIAVYM